jgi:integrase
MVKRDVKGIFKVQAKGRIYFYAWRGPPLGPRLRGEEGSPEFWQSYNEAIADRQMPDKNKFRALVADYRASNYYAKLADSTKSKWGPWLDRVGEYFGALSIAQFNRPERIRPVIRTWRHRFADTPRTADYGLGVLSRVLSHGVELGKLAGNPCDGIKQLYTSNRADIVWTDSDITRIKRTCSLEIAWAVDLAAYTGLRQSDLLSLNWSHIEDDMIVIATSKSGHKREAAVPIYDALREVLNKIPKRSTRVLTNTRKLPWSKNSFSGAFNRAKKTAGMADQNLHFHDLRGTAATKFYIAGLKTRLIADILGWSEDNVEKIIKRYVDRSATIKAMIKQLNAHRNEQ